MSCDEVRVALPILPDGDADGAARIRAHCAACAPCAVWMAHTVSAIASPP